jgi:hypothetical protein
MGVSGCCGGAGRRHEPDRHRKLAPLCSAVRSRRQASAQRSAGRRCIGFLHAPRRPATPRTRRSTHHVDGPTMRDAASRPHLSRRPRRPRDAVGRRPRRTPARVAEQKDETEGTIMRRLPSLIALRFFEETARHMSFHRAAVALCVTQGAVSRQNKILEESLGAKLFERDHKGIRLTKAGQRLLPCVSDAFCTLERGTRQVMTAKGRRRLYCPCRPRSRRNGFRRASARSQSNCRTSNCPCARSPPTTVIATSASSASRCPARIPNS